MTEGGGGPKPLNRFFMRACGHRLRARLGMMGEGGSASNKPDWERLTEAGAGRPIFFCCGGPPPLAPPAPASVGPAQSPMLASGWPPVLSARYNGQLPPPLPALYCVRGGTRRSAMGGASLQWGGSFLCRRAPGLTRPIRIGSAPRPAHLLAGAVSRGL